MNHPKYPPTSGLIFPPRFPSLSFFTTLDPAQQIYGHSESHMLLAVADVESPTNQHNQGKYGGGGGAAVNAPEQEIKASAAECFLGDKGRRSQINKL